MNRRSLLRCGWPVLASVLLISLISGCGDDKSTTPTPSPKLSMSVADDQGLMLLTVQNSGGPMAAPSLFCAEYVDGHCDTLALSLAAGETKTCRLSNIHGGVTVTNEGWNLQATMDDCLAEYFESLMPSVNLGSFVPSPLGQGDVLLCTYTYYLNNLAYDQVTFDLIPTDSGLTLRYVFSTITGNIVGTSPGALCADFTGNVSISTVVVETQVDFGEGESPQVTLGTTDATINGLVVNIDGTFGFVIDWIVSWVQGSLVGDIENAIAASIDSQIGSDLSNLVIVNTECAQ